MHMSTQKRTLRRNVCSASVVLTLLLVAGADRAFAQGTTTQDIVITKPTDKSSPKLATQSADEVSGICGKNPNCRVVRDDAAITAFCVGDNCVAAKKKTGKQDVFLQVKMKDVMVSDVARIQGRPITTSQGIIAILVGQVAPPSSAGSQIRDAQKMKSPAAPPAGLLEDRSPGVASPATSPGSARSKALREDVKSTTGGPGGPTIK
jgi:hypothetical protein